ncbi:MAG TPA: RNA polymerase [Algoriphagus sp.]|uniref:RNA polymerase sigma factor n=1 Tax=unclassified Algoriphagus TaxID=2641541 RepID=UPI000C501E99|nr:MULTISPECIES: sigma-70 family RNA polymerase sigma factor [unclassified Algoriphagus]MAL13937.1 RNA polymerase [Algoriphagus sp.]MAN86918.1 RNA polymerase [Algoriphagus sp.]QYH37294.1 sigma-70 family RNA polymerase sigma factor [Algoriphagus sp. NBT04N3]HAS60011.1 RNA polymerase [Algoriphagus sp.]HCD86333.1 RNA polymerase [Algoriphagus sp.]
MQEDQLIQGLRARDKKTVDYLYEKYSRALLGVIFRIISDQDIAEEVFHDAFIKITRKIDSYEESKGRLYTWMANICRNSAIDKLRSKEISQSSKTNGIDDFVYGLESQSGTEEHVEGIGVKELMNELNEDQKFVIEYIYFKGYTHSEISEEFEIPLGTVKSRVRAALLVLKKNIDRI